MKKKILVIALTLGMMLTLNACGKSDAAQAVDDKIQSIGTVSLESGDLITEIENDYMKLSDKEKKQLEYYKSYEMAKEQYEKLASEQKAEEEAKEEANNNAVSEIESLISENKSTEAKNKIEQIEDADVKSEMQNKLKAKCYSDIDLIKFNEVVSVKSDSSKEDTDEGDRRFSYYYYSIWGDIQTAFNDYNLYLNQNCEKTESQDMMATSYHYKLDDKEITIMLFDSAVGGDYMLQIIYDK